MAAGLTGFAISQPLLSILGEEPTILTFHGVEGSALVVLACAIALGPAVSVWVLTRLASLAGPRAGRAVHLVSVLGLVALFTIQVAKAAGLEHGALLVGVAIVAGTAFAVAYARSIMVATWASYTGILPLLAVVFFLVASPASALLSSVEEPDRVAGSGDQPPVVLIVLDELPTRSLLDGDDQIDRDRFPNLAGFADDGTWYRHHTTVATMTEAAVPSMLASTLPTTEQALWTNHPDNLFTLLAPTHELEVLEQASELCPYDSCAPTAAIDGAPTDGSGTGKDIDVGGPGLVDLLRVTKDLWFDRVSLGGDEPTGFDDFEEQVGQADDQLPDDQPGPSPSVTVRPPPSPDGDPPQALSSARADALIRSFDAAKGPALYYLHLMLPHQPWHLYPDGEDYAVLDAKGLELPLQDQKELFSWSPWASAVSEQQHLLQAQYTDRVVGQLLDGLRAEGIYDDSLVIVTSDHGVSFESHTAGRYLHPSTIDAIAYAPLLVKEPRQTAGRVDDANVTNLDVLPTVANHLGLTIPWDIAGAPAGSAAVEARDGTKEIYDMIGYGGLQILGIVEFDDATTFADIGDRWIGPLPDPADPLSALHARLGLGGVIGQPLGDLPPAGTEIVIDGLDALRRPPEGESRLGLVTGRVASAPEDATLVLAIDGVVIGGSLLSTDSDGNDGHIAVLLPQGVLERENEVRAALVVGGELRELRVTGR